MTLKDLHKSISELESTPLMPMLFVGHGSPMNAVEDNEFSRMWTSLGAQLPTPRAIVCISAHWETKGTHVTIGNPLETIHDFYGFPGELYRQKYPSPGSPSLAQEVIDNIQSTHVKGDDQWGLDHGTWTILKYTYPLANIPVIQISIDHDKDAQWHYNLRIMRITGNDFNAEYGYDWAFELNDILKNKLIDGDDLSLINYRSLHKDAELAIPTPEHYIPMLYVLGLRNKDEKVRFFNDKVIAASLNMTSFIVGE